MSLFGSFRAAVVVGLSLSVVGCATAPPTVEQVNAVNAGREAKCEQQGYKRGTKDFYTCTRLAENKEAIDSSLNPIGTSMAVGTAVGLAGMAAGMLSDERVKRDVVSVGRQNGYKVYRFKYLWSDQTYVGVMAQEVRNATPAAVIVGDDGYLRVNYDLLGLRMVTLEEWETRGRSAVRKLVAAE